MAASAGFRHPDSVLRSRHEDTWRTVQEDTRAMPAPRQAGAVDERTGSAGPRSVPAHGRSSEAEPRCGLAEPRCGQAEPRRGLAERGCRPGSGSAGAAGPRCGGRRVEGGAGGPAMRGLQSAVRHLHRPWRRVQARRQELQGRDPNSRLGRRDPGDRPCGRGDCHKPRGRIILGAAGQVSEWLKEPVSKTGKPATVSRVRIPPCP